MGQTYSNIAKSLAILLLLVIFGQGCSSARKIRKNEKAIEERLMRSYSHWKGTPYKFGGTTSSGVDCSALIRNIYRKEFEIDLPRTTVEQIKTGKRVKAKNLKSGDIVFFKTGRRQLHSGIYLRGGKFMHASTSQGVTISEMRNAYWRKRYVRARRVLY